MWPLYFLIIFGLIGGTTAAVLGVIVKSKRARKDAERSRSLVRLHVNLPKKEGQFDRQKEVEKDVHEVIGSAEQLFAGLHGILKNGLQPFMEGQDFIGFEIAARDFDTSDAEEEISFFVLTPPHLQTLVEKQITSYYPEAIIEPADEFSIIAEGAEAIGAQLSLKKPFPYPLKSFRKLDADPLNDITNILGQLQINEGAAVQVMIRPRNNSWVIKSRSLARRTAKQRTLSMNKFLIFIDMIFNEFRSSKNAPQVSDLQREQIKAIEEKTSKVAFDTVVRLVAASTDKARAEAQLHSMISTFAQFEDPNINGLSAQYNAKYAKMPVKAFLSRAFDGYGKPYILNTEELAGIFHFPNSFYNRTPSIKWQMSKFAPAPALLPTEGTLLGYNRHRGEERKVYLSDKDRFRHLYVMGQTGTGKSVLLKSLIKQDLAAGNGVCVVDPHGDLIDECMQWVPVERADDVILFDPSDTQRPMGLNLLEAHTNEEKDFIALDAMNMMIGLFGPEIFGPRIQDYFRNACLTLMDDEEEGGALTDIVRLFTDPAWQQYKVSKVKNPIVKSFWTKQMASTGNREKEEMIPFLAAKFGAFVTNSMMRNIVGQTKSAFSFEDVMSNKKILFVKLSKGQIGDINANLLGMIFVNKIQVAAMRRAALPEAERTPFYLYVDEFQNFVTDAFESILSEARKYKLGLTIAHQYIGQLLNKSAYGNGNADKIKNAVFGNVGTMLTFKIGAQDAEYMSKEMAPTFSEQDLINLEHFHACMKMSVNGQITPPFSITTFKDFAKGNTDSAEAMRELSRLKFGKNLQEVDSEILERLGSGITFKTNA